MLTTKLLIKTKSKSYSIIVGNQILETTGSLIKKKFSNINKIAIITDKNLPSSILKKIKKSLNEFELITIKLPAGEKIKNIKIATKIINKLLSKNFNRSDCVIALGGGVIGDLSGFISSLVKRGVGFVNIPTTLLAQVDASVGGKTAINSNYGKNLIGVFYQPDLVIADTSVLKHLPKREIVSGYAEILKHSLILDRKFFFWLSKKGKKILVERDNASLKKAIIRSCKIKSSVVSIDENEKNFRMILNFGHTFGHSFERVTNFSKKLNHGEGVLLGMLMASQISYKKKLLKLEDLKLIQKHYNNFDLPKDVKKYFKKNQVNSIIKFMKNDKKNINNNINLVLLKSIGRAIKSKFVSVVFLKKFIKDNLH